MLRDSLCRCCAWNPNSKGLGIPEFSLLHRSAAQQLQTAVFPTFVSILQRLKAMWSEFFANAAAACTVSMQQLTSSQTFGYLVASDITHPRPPPQLLGRGVPGMSHEPDSYKHRFRTAPSGFTTKLLKDPELWEMLVSFVLQPQQSHLLVPLLDALPRYA